MIEITTNRDLYCFIADLVKKQSHENITLESYLANLRQLAHARCDLPVLSLEQFAGLLEAAFDSPAPGEATCAAAADGYQDWETRISQQIQDLREMEQAGTLANEYRYFGVDAPSGARWYNFDPCTFLECAAAGTFGGWQEGDDTDREYVPGQVAVIDASGAMTAMDPRDIEEPVVCLAAITWQAFVEFLESGQWYE